MLMAEPMSTWSHCGHTPLVLSQYVLASPSVESVAVCAPFTWLLAVAGRPNATLVLVPIPLPDKATVVGLLLALLVTVRVPDRLPDAVGRNVTVTVQDAPTAIDEQLFVCVKSPVAATDDTVADVVPLFDNATDCVALAAPTTVPAKVRLAGFAFRIGPGATPVPLSETVLVVPPALTVRLPVRLPVVVGLNVTLAVHEAPAAIDVPQVFVWAKSPLVAMDVIAAALVPLFVMVTDCADSS
jgi:hypothetical protein